jgi:hypothetical protein
MRTASSSVLASLRFARLARIALAASFALTAAAASSATWGQGDNPWLDRELTRQELVPIAEQSSQYLLRNQLPDGQFVYIKDPTGKCCGPKGDKYSLIRHLGGVYALLRTYELTKDERYLKGAKAGIDFTARFREVGPGSPLAIVRGTKGQVSLGENGFLLINAVLYDQFTGAPKDKGYGPMSDDLAKFLASALIYNGPYQTKGQWAECQGLIGLAMYHMHRKPNDAYMDVARAWLTAMAKDGQHSHWSAQAVWWLEKASPSPTPYLTDYALTMGKKLMDDVVVGAAGGSKDKSRFVGSRGRKFNSCGATARNEGLIACHLLARAKNRPEEARWFHERAREHIAYALQFQYGLPGNLYESDPEMTRMATLFDLAGGVFNNPKHSFIRVDYVSHHVRAMWAWLTSPAVPGDTGLTMKDLEAGGAAAGPAAVPVSAESPAKTH